MKTAILTIVLFCIMIFPHELGHFLAELTNMKALDVLPYHTMGKVKYERLGMEYPLGDTPPLSKEEAIRARGYIIEGIKEAL